MVLNTSIILYMHTVPYDTGTATGIITSLLRLHAHEYSHNETKIANFPGRDSRNFPQRATISFFRLSSKKARKPHGSTHLFDRGQTEWTRAQRQSHSQTLMLDVHGSYTEAGSCVAPLLVWDYGMRLPWLASVGNALAHCSQRTVRCWQTSGARAPTLEALVAQDGSDWPALLIFEVLELWLEGARRDGELLWRNGRNVCNVGSNVGCGVWNVGMESSCDVTGTCHGGV